MGKLTFVKNVLVLFECIFGKTREKHRIISYVYSIKKNCKNCFLLLPLLYEKNTHNQ